MDTEFKISIGMEKGAPPSPTDYTRVNFDFELHGQRIKSITEDLRTKTGKYRIPTVIFDFPSSAKDLDLDIFQTDEDKQYDQIQKDGRVYKCLDILVPEFTSTKKKIQKLFSKLTELDNKLYLHLDLYNVDSYEQKLKEKQDYPLVVFLEQSKIEGKFSLDPNFFQVAAQCIKRISPKFAESPIMAILPLFGGIDCQLVLDSLNQLQKQNQQQLFQMFSYEEPDDDEEGKKTKQLFKNREKANIYLSFGEMGILRVQLQVRMFAFYNCLG